LGPNTLTLNTLTLNTLTLNTLTLNTLTLVVTPGAAVVIDAERSTFDTDYANANASAAGAEFFLPGEHWP
jgi:hypothetical protein